MTSAANMTTKASSLSVTEAFVVHCLEQADDADLSNSALSSHEEHVDVRFDGSVAMQRIIQQFNGLTETAYKSAKEKTAATAEWSEILRELETKNLIEGIRDNDPETNEPVTEPGTPLFWKITVQGAVVAVQLRAIFDLVNDSTDSTDIIDDLDALDAHFPPCRRRQHQRRTNDRRGKNDRRNEFDRRASGVSSE
jgi:hypothetical protein